jgi:hypothetical protein
MSHGRGAVPECSGEVRSPRLEAMLPGRARHAGPPSSGGSPRSSPPWRSAATCGRRRPRAADRSSVWRPNTRPVAVWAVERPVARQRGEAGSGSCVATDATSRIRRRRPRSGVIRPTDRPSAGPRASAGPPRHGPPRDAAHRGRYRHSTVTTSTGAAMPLSATLRRAPSANACRAPSSVAALTRISPLPAAPPIRAARFTPEPT